MDLDALPAPLSVRPRSSWESRLSGKDVSLSEMRRFAAVPVTGVTGAAGAGMRRALWSWTALAAVSLAVAAVLALILAASRSPGMLDVLPAGWDLVFKRVLVTHVVLASVVWCLAALGAMATLAAGQGPTTPLAATAPAGVLAGVLLMLAPTLAGLGDVSANDFIPVIVHPLYYSGLACVALGVSMPIARLLRTVDVRNPFAVATAAAGLTALLAFLCFLGAWLRMPAGLEPLAYNDILFWGGGHILQFAYAALTLAGWHALAERAYGEAPLPPPVFIAAVATMLPFVLPAPVYVLALDLGGDAYRSTFAGLMRYGLVAGPLMVAGGALRLACRRRSHDRTASLALLLSIALFVAGGAVGFFLPGGDTRTPAHYHASLSGVNLALMGIFWSVILPALGRPMLRGRVAQLQLSLFGFGQLVFAIGLFLAGIEGVPRKTAGLAQGLDSLTKLVAMGLAGAGGVVAVSGGVLFVCLLLVHLLARAETTP
jgi:cytochrome c oxidase subunit I